MRLIRRWRLTRLAKFTIALGVISALAIGTAHACKVPVFRYALERWEADAYRLQILVDDAPADADSNAKSNSDFHDAVAAIADKTVNLEVQQYNVDQLTESQRWQLGEIPDDGQRPLLRLYAPAEEHQDEIFWEGPATTENVNSIVTSPVREQIVQEISTGASAVWVVIPGETEEATKTLEANLKKTLAELETEMNLPEGVIGAGEVDHASFRPDEPIDLDDVLRSHIPLRLKFTVLRLNPNDPKERITAALFSRLLPPGGGAIPVYGRGRALPGIPAARIDKPVLRRANEYIIGSCSCQVKAENPGVDLLVSADWNTLLNDNLLVASRDLPPLEGVAIVKDANDVGNQTDPNVATDLPSVGSATDTQTSVTSTSQNRLWRNMLGTVVAILLATVAGTLWIRRQPT